jgi:hypothetical protein
LDAGQNLNTIRISFDSLDMKDLQLACGLVKRKGTTVHTSETNRWMSLWGLTTEDTVNGSLGTGIVMPRSTTIRFTEDNDQYLVVVNADAHVTFTYYAGAGWTRSGDFSSADDWNSYLDSFSRRIQTPLKILITPEK